MITVTTTDYDKVLDSKYLTGSTTYRYAVDKIYSLINRFNHQRKLQDEKFYSRLREDILSGCIMPPITMAFVIEDLSIEDYQEYINANIDKAYILDGIQRLNALKRVSDKEEFPFENKVYINFILAKSQDKLLYRMITLNNGQKPMTPRHQIEILSQELFDFSNLQNMKIRTEKELSEKRELNCFRFSDITKAYLAFLTNNVNNENSKIIAEEMDKIIVNRIMDQGVPNSSVTFEKILAKIDKLCLDEKVSAWFRVENNIIGFAAGVKDVFSTIEEMDIEVFKEITEKFEESFKIINVSKVKLGQTRRELVIAYIKDIQDTSRYSITELKEYVTEKA